MAGAGNKDDTKASATPPYVSFPTLKTLLKSFQEHGTPGRIDRSVLQNFSGSVAGQLIPALRFLKLIDASNHPTNGLQEIVSAYASDVWPSNLKGILDAAYEPLSKINLQTASPSQFDEAFSKAYPGAENVLRKCKSFYLAAASEAKIPISPYIMRNKKPRTGPSKKRAPKNGAGKNLGADGGNFVRVNPLNENVDQSTKPLSQQLLEILTPDTMPGEVQQAILTLLVYLRKEGK